MLKKIAYALPSVCAAGFVLAVTSFPVAAYDGQTCVAPGNCWEPKPGFPAKVAGSKYDPKHNPKELAKQSESITAMEERNAKRVAAFKKTGKFVYEVEKISD
ncbi:methanol dehydrogenase [cytochrome c] subunit [Methylocella silvestris]|uniref:Methanol dehydrogenase [cytochrome c] subunit 2 n=1 Tax=Methylocella silvestris TaxID=199596 RepID=A0A2J7TEV4_METSI|nr:methanol dehydrogenase [cytochrome c] subunit [Methylocella silvestris]PNG25291.1 methanol dehydrogenase [Methylocella silvestris]